jgi:beta-propeller repeat-containing protein
MRRFGFASLVSWSVLIALSARAAETDGASMARAKTTLAQLPLRFEANQGRMDSSVQYAARAGGYNLLLTAQGPAFSFPNAPRIDMALQGSNRAAKIEALGPLATRTDSFLGGRERWRTAIPSYSRVRYNSVYPGIDVIYYGNQNQLEFDFVLQPGADPNAIRMQFRGAKKLRLTSGGDLVLEAGSSRIVQKRPLIYQEEPGPSQRREVGGRYRLLARNTVALDVGDYDRTRPVVIDPVINYLTYMGGGAGDRINAMKLGPDGRLYIAGQTDGELLTPTEGAYRDTRPGKSDIFLAIIDTRPQGNNALAYFSYLGGSDQDVAWAIDVDAGGFVYMTGSTKSTDFPLAGNAIQSTGAAATAEAFVVKLRPQDVGGDALWYSTYLGGVHGDDTGSGIAVDKDGMIYVIGTSKSDDFPATSNAYQPVIWGTQDAFVCKIDPNTGSLLYATYLGGEGIDEGRAIAVGSDGLVYFGATTLSQQFTWAGFAYSTNPFGAQDVVIGILDMNKSGFDSLQYASYFGGSGNDDVLGLALDNNNKLVITGYTLSNDFPVTADAMQAANVGNGDVYISVFDPRLPSQSGLLYSTFLGGSGGDVAYAARADSAGNLYVTGYSMSKDFPIAGAAPQPEWGGGTNIFLTKFRPGVAGRAALLFSTFLGATGTSVPTSLALGPDGAMYVGGYSSNGLPITESHIQAFGGGVSDGFVFVIQQ